MVRASATSGEGEDFGWPVEGEGVKRVADVGADVQVDQLARRAGGACSATQHREHCRQHRGHRAHSALQRVRGLQRQQASKFACYGKTQRTRVRHASRMLGTLTYGRASGRVVRWKCPPSRGVLLALRGLGASLGVALGVPPRGSHRRSRGSHSMKRTRAVAATRAAARAREPAAARLGRRHPDRHRARRDRQGRRPPRVALRQPRGRQAPPPERPGRGVHWRPGRDHHAHSPRRGGWRAGHARRQLVSPRRQSASSPTIPALLTGGTPRRRPDPDALGHLQTGHQGGAIGAVERVS